MNLCGLNATSAFFQKIFPVPDVGRKRKRKRISLRRLRRARYITINYYVVCPRDGKYETYFYDIVSDETHGDTVQSVTGKYTALLG